jgi:hypothetical protein
VLFLSPSKWLRYLLSRAEGSHLAALCAALFSVSVEMLETYGTSGRSGALCVLQL